MKMALIYPGLYMSFVITIFADEAPDAAKNGNQITENAPAPDAAARLQDARHAREIAMLDIEASRNFHLLLLNSKVKELEAAKLAQEALDEFRRLSVRLKNENPKKWESKIHVIEMYAYKLHNAEMERANARILIHAESPKARI